MRTKYLLRGDDEISDSFRAVFAVEVLDKVRASVARGQPARHIINGRRLKGDKKEVTGNDASLP